MCVCACASKQQAADCRQQIADSRHQSSSRETANTRHHTCAPVLTACAPTTDTFMCLNRVMSGIISITLMRHASAIRPVIQPPCPTLSALLSALSSLLCLLCSLLFTLCSLLSALYSLLSFLCPPLSDIAQPRVGYNIVVYNAENKSQKILTLRYYHHSNYVPTLCEHHSTPYRLFVHEAY
jgi:hypothetical protein